MGFLDQFGKKNQKNGKIMTSYLSVDLDFWSEHDLEKGDNSSYAFFKRICKLGLPILVVRDHEFLLPHMDLHKCDTLYNVDYHSDIFGFINSEDRNTWYEENPEPDCGTWSVYVQWRTGATFHWMYPYSQCYGNGCFHGNGKGACWKDSTDNPYLSGVLKPWGKIVRSKGFSKIDWTSIRAVGISVSPEYFSFATVAKICLQIGYAARDSNENLIQILNENPQPFLYDPITGEDALYIPSIEMAQKGYMQCHQS